MNAHHHLIKIIENVGSDSWYCSLVGSENDTASINFFPKAFRRGIAPPTEWEFTGSICYWMQHFISRSISSRPIDVSIISIRTFFIYLPEPGQWVTLIIFFNLVVVLENSLSNLPPIGIMFFFQGLEYLPEFIYSFFVSSKNDLVF